MNFMVCIFILEKQNVAIEEALAQPATKIEDFVKQFKKKRKRKWLKIEFKVCILNKWLSPDLK